MRSSSREKRRSSSDVERCEKKRREEGSPHQIGSLLGSLLPAGGDASPSGDVNRSSETTSNDKLDRLTCLLSDLINRLGNSAPF